MSRLTKTFHGFSAEAAPGGLPVRARTELFTYGGRRRGGLGVVGVFLLGLAGLGLFAVGALMPVGFTGTDPAVLEEAGRGTQSFDYAGEPWLDAGKPGTAVVFENAVGRLHAHGDDFALVPIRMRDEDSFLQLWGGADPFLEQVFVDYQPELSRANPPVLPLFVPRQARQELGSFFESSRNPGVRAVLANREVEFADRFMPVDSSAGQPLEATLYLTTLLLQGNHVSQELAAEIRRLAEAANEGNRLGEVENIYLDVLALGSRLQWQPLADLMPLLPDRQALRRTAHLSRVLEDDFVVFAAAGLWTRSPGELSRYLVEQGESGMGDLKRAMQAGRGAVELLLDRQETVHSATWRSWLPADIPVLLAGIHADSPVGGTVLRMTALFLGLVILFVAINLFFQVEAVGKTLSRPFAFTVFQALLLATGFVMAFLFLTEPLAAQEGQSEFRIALPLSLASDGVHSPLETGLSLDMDQLTLISLTVFFVTQMILYIICWIKVMEIRRQPVASHLKLKLLENEDHLFDAGLYIGLAGTVGALIFLALGVVGPSLMAAYASTLFGIVFVAFFKIFHLRPYRRRLIIESQAHA